MVTILELVSDLIITDIISSHGASSHWMAEILDI